MTLSPKKYVSNFTSSTTNRGVQAKEIAMPNTRIETERSSSGEDAAEDVGGAGAAAAGAGGGGGGCGGQLPADDSASYIQVVVQKRSGGGAACARVPRASSPLRAKAAGPTGAGGAAATGWPAGGDGVLLLPRQLLMAYSAAAPWAAAAGDGGGAAVGGTVAGTNDAKALPAATYEPRTTHTKGEPSDATFKKNELNSSKYSIEDSGPEGVEVYYFERGSATGEFLATSDGWREAALERQARRVGRRARRVLAEALAVPRLALAAPLALLLQLERCGLLLLRGALLGGVQTAADYALKPALALVFNALLQPPLVLLGNCLRATRDALRPLWLALGDALEPAARLLRATRLVHVHVERACSCQQPSPPPREVYSSPC